MAAGIAVLYDAPLDGLLKKFEHQQKVFFSADDDFRLTLPYERTSLREYAVTCHPKDLQKIVSEIVSQVPIISIRTEETSLEDAIFSIFDERKAS